MNRLPSSRTLLIVLALVVAGCGSSTSVESPPLSGQRVQGTSLVAQGAIPYRVGAYEFTFPTISGVGAQARRAALLVDMAADQGHVSGFVEWGKSGDVPLTYVAGGWARHRAVRGELVTVFELALSNLDVRDRHHAVTDPERFTPLAVRVVADEASGDVTLTRRR